MNKSKEWSWFRVLTKVEQINDNITYSLTLVKKNPIKNCMYEWGEVIRNDNEVRKAEQGQYQIYSSESSPCVDIGSYVAE